MSERKIEARYSASSAAEAMYRAEQILKQSPQVEQFITDIVLREAAAERHFSFQWVAEQVRAKDFVGLNGRPFKVNNNYIAALTRIFIKRYPQIKPYVETRRSKCGEMMICG